MKQHWIPFIPSFRQFCNPPLLLYHKRTFRCNNTVAWHWTSDKNPGFI